MVEANQKLYINRQEGFIGTGLKKDEFVCNCSDIDDIIVFRALTEQDIEEVARRMLKTVAGRMEAMDIHLDASDEAVKELAKEGFDPRYGARPLRRAIQSKVEDAVAEKMLDGTLKTGDTAKLAVEDDKLVVTK